MYATRFMPAPAMAALGFYLLACFASVPASADLYWESEQVVKNMPGQEDGTRIVKNYITKDASRTDMGDTISIIKYDEMAMYQLNPDEKTYVKIDMKSMGMPGGGEMDAEQAAQAQSLMQEMFGKIKVVPSDETRTIAGYKCMRYDLNFMMVNTEYWTSKEVKGYEVVAAAGKKMQKAFEGNPILKNANILGMMDSLEGFPVQIVNRMMGGTSTTTLKKIEQKTLPRSLFEIPKDYKRVESPGMSPPAMPPTAQPPGRRLPGPGK